MAFLSICPSVRLSVKGVVCDKTKEVLPRFVWKNVYPSFPTKKWLIRDDLCTWNFEPNWSRSSKNADFQSIFARSASVVTPSEKSSINTNRKSFSPFRMSLRWTSYVAPKPYKGAKTQAVVFRVKLHFTWRNKVCYKVSLCEYGSEKVIRLHWPIYPCKNSSPETSPTTWKFGRNWPTPFENAYFQSIFARSASAVTPIAKKFN